MGRLTVSSNFIPPLYLGSFTIGWPIESEYHHQIGARVSIDRQRVACYQHKRVREERENVLKDQHSVSIYIYIYI